MHRYFRGQMPEYLQHLRRGATQLAIRQVIAATAPLPMGAQRSALRSLVAVAGSMPTLRRRVCENMRLALGHDVPANAERLYFRHVAWFWSNALATFHHGFTKTPVPQLVNFDDSVRLLDEAVAEGRGVVLASPHWSGYDLAAARINLRHPMVFLVRQAPTPERAARKLKWYNALGAEIVLRPSGASSIKDAVAYLKVLKRGRTLGIAPDLLADEEQGVEVSIFGRPARLYGGAFALAIAAGAPMIRPFPRWQDDSKMVVAFQRAPCFDNGDRDAAVRAAVQDWCLWFENRLRANPENWLFWLDKRWSRFLRTTPRASGIQ
jgi:lauroyl/myristoyl acyltransferase